MPLDWLEEHGGPVLDRLGEDLQQVAVLVPVGQDAELAQLSGWHAGVADPGTKLVVVAVAERLAAISEVLEVHTISGPGDVLGRVVARTNADLQRVLDAIVSTEGVVRSATLISLATQVSCRVLPLVRAASHPLRAPTAPPTPRLRSVHPVLP